MINAMEMVSMPDGKMLPLSEYLKEFGGGGKMEIVEELPEASEDVAGKLFVLNVVSEPTNVTLFDAKGVAADMISGASHDFETSWIDYSEISFQGGNKDNGDIWDITKIISPVEDVEFNITSDGNTIQGTYVLSATGITRKSDPYNHCAINKVTGVTKPGFPKLVMCVNYDSSYVWVDLVRNTIII